MSRRAEPPPEGYEVPYPPGRPGPPITAGRGSRMLGRRAVLVSTGSTIVFFAIIAAALALAPGSGIVRERFFSWFHIRQSFFGTPTSPLGVAEAFLLNVKMFLIAEVIILVLALVIAVVRGVPGPVFFPLRAVAVAYTDLFRGIPLILVLYMIGFGAPGLGLRFFSSQSDVTYGVVALVLVYSAYVAEVYRAGIDSVHESQTAAARSLGLSRWQSLRFVILPQAIRRVIPPLLNDFIGLQKDTALVSVLGSIEAARAAQIYGAEQFNYASYVVAAALFVLVTIPLARFTDHLIERDRRRRQAGATL
ncbi:MAG: amino acid ABC transporter permease [Actinomycetota bacterium]